MQLSNYVADEARVGQVADFMSRQMQGSALSHQNYTMDADGTLFAARQLEYIESRIYMTEYARFKAREVFPINSEASEGHTSITYNVMDYTGKAARLNTHNATDIPLVGLAMKKVNNPIRHLAVAYGWGVIELKQAQIARLRLQEHNAFAARDVLRKETDSIAWFGDTELGLTGFLDNPLIPKGNAPKTFETSTPDEILEQLRGIFAEVLINTKEIEEADTLLMPTKQFDLLQQPRSSLSDKSIIQWFLENNKTTDGRMRKIISVPELAGAGTNDTDIMIAYRKDPMKLEMNLPMDIMIEAPQLRDLFWKVNMRTATAGVIVRYPQSINIKEGI